MILVTNLSYQMGVSQRWWPTLREAGMRSTAAVQ
jgi:hypothetical protein